MNSEYIRYFIAACDYGSLFEASKRLYISPQGLGQGIQRLEKSIGLQLLKTTRGGCAPTEFGTIFYKQGLAVLNELSKIEALAEEYSNTKELTFSVGTIGTTKFYQGFLGYIKSYKAACPDSRLRLSVVKMNDNQELRAGILEDRVEVGLMYHTDTSEEFSYYNLSDFSRLLLLICRDNPLAKQSEVSWEQLKQLQYILPAEHDPYTNLLKCLFRDQGITPDFTYCNTENILNARLLDNDMYVMLCRERYSRLIMQFTNNTAVLPVVPTVNIAHSLFWKKDRSFHNEHRDFLNGMLDYFGTLLT